MPRRRRRRRRRRSSSSAARVRLRGRRRGTRAAASTTENTTTHTHTRIFAVQVLHSARSLAGCSLKCPVGRPGPSALPSPPDAPKLGSSAGDRGAASAAQRGAQWQHRSARRGTREDAPEVSPPSLQTPPRGFRREVANSAFLLPPSNACCCHPRGDPHNSPLEHRCHACRHPAFATTASRALDARGGDPPLTINRRRGGKKKR
ncbi:hypothetical protein HPB47_000943 [Ixodes persulcatus]|uniref:Uncharacterized protein n=1 Tax=Ixodes persulcatus TaxID=34615 RepID=A0AC60PQP6_IXOPE|nr:hypothetical protein HPB47_000943 [Ixodes persulcatus]